MNNQSLASRISAFLAFSFISISILLTGCGSDSTTAVGDQDASGLYKSGIASLNNDLTIGDNVINADDFVGIVHGGRFLVFSTSVHLLLDGNITSITGNDFTATADAYINGVNAQPDITITGQVTTASSIEATLHGDGLANGTINIVFDPLYNRGATAERADTTDSPRWLGDNYTVDNDVIRVEMYPGGGLTISDFTAICGALNTASGYTIPSNEINIYQLHAEFINGISPCSYAGVGYNGFGSVIDGTGGSDNTLLYAMTNGTNSVFGVLTYDLNLPQ